MSGYTYESLDATVPGHSQTAVSAACPDGQFPVGGGMRIGGKYGADVTLNMTAPYNLSVTDDWASFAQNEGSHPQTATAFAVCSATAPQAVVSSGNVAPRSQFHSSIPCPSSGLNNFLLGGGVVTGGDYSSHVSLETSSTSASGGWQGTVNNRGATSQSVDVIALCGAAGTAPEHGTRSVPAHALGSITVACPANSVVTGGGASTNSTNLNVAIQSTKPVDNGDADDAPTNGWRSTLRNGSGRQVRLTGWAVCEPV